MKVVILAGGLGTRLAEETEVRPKPMVTIGGRPILWHIMKHYSQAGFCEFVVALGYKGEIIKRYFMDYADLNGQLDAVPEESRHRTARHTSRGLEGRSRRNRQRHRRPAAAQDGSATSCRDGHVHDDLRRRRVERRSAAGARLSPLARPARHGHRRAPAGTLRQSRVRRRSRHAASSRSRSSARAGSTAASSCSSPTSSTTSPATTCRSSVSRWSNWRRWTADGVPARRLLAKHGYAARQAAPGIDCGKSGAAPMAHMAVAERRT